MSRKWMAALVGAALLLAAAYLASPYWAVRQFKQAALSADADRLDAAVDFPAVRQSLKSQLNVALTARMQNDPEMKGNPFAGLGMMMIPAVVDKAVDGFVTPEGISAIMKRGRVKDGGAAPAESSKAAYDSEYSGLDRFIVSAKAPDAKEGESIKFVFERRGLFSWKLIRLEIPEEAFATTSR